MKDGITRKCLIVVEKYREGERPGVDAPYERLEAWNLGLTVGSDEILKLFTGQGGSPFTNANAQIGVGDSNTAPVASQTDLQAATNKTYIGMQAGYPTAPANGQVQFQAVFGSADASYTWAEFVIKNSVSGICVNRSTNGGTGWGVKASGAIWTVTATYYIQ